MREIQFDCPHCGTRQGGKYRSIVPFRTGRASAFATCNMCGKGSVLYVSCEIRDPDLVGRDMLRHEDGEEFLGEMKLLDMAPKIREPRLICDLPDPIRRAYVDGEQHLTTKHWRSAVVAYRTALERAIKVLDTDQTINQRNLFQKIEAFGRGYALPQSLIDLMHSVRDFGNEVHEIDEPTEADATLASDCATLLLIYLFELPARVERAGARKERAAG